MDHEAATGRVAWGRAVGVAVALSVVVVTVLLAFLWPIVDGRPEGCAGRHLRSVADRGRVRVAGAEVFAFTEVADRDAAVAAIESRELYGALLLDPTGPEVLVSSAANAAVAQQLGALAGVLQQQLNRASGRSGRGDGERCRAAGVDGFARGRAHRILVPAPDRRAPRRCRRSALVVTGVWRRLVSVVVYAGVAGFSVTAVTATVARHPAG